ncbi:MAG TPA: FtsQ-type POTRA domain-containing protein [Ktedonobacteraceae bacterium]|nr:FtsQ-type POTRA domain-containing protein [Ktedonobacteraceae bacterium]
MSYSYRDEMQEPRKRKVSMPEVIAQPMNPAQRRARYERLNPRQTRQAPRRGNRLVKRTLAQTGTAAPEGPVRIVRTLPPQRTPIPVRSGQHKRKRGFWQRFLTLFALIALATIAAGFALFSPNFRVRQITVVGTSNPALIGTIQQMGMQGQNIFLIDVTGFTTRIDALPAVASASIQKAWPNQLSVTVVERLPVLLWHTPAATFSVDSHGVVIGLASETTGADQLMAVVDARSKGVTQRVQPGTHLNAADVTFALQVFERLPQVAGVTAFTLRYSAAPGSQSSGDGSFIVESQQGWIAYLGSADDNNPLDNRLVELQQILSRAHQEQLNLATIDLRYGLRPVFTVKS